MNKVGIVDFGGQYTQLIKSVLIKLGIVDVIIFDDKNFNINDNNGISCLIFSGGPSSTYDTSNQAIDKLSIIKCKMPILGICYGFQLLANIFGGSVVECNEDSEFGLTKFNVDKKSILFNGLPNRFNVVMSHRDKVYKLPSEFINLGYTKKTEISAYESEKYNIYAVQFHPEVSNTEYGIQIIKNFLVKANCKFESFDIIKSKDKIINNISNTVKNNYAFCAFSGGIDSLTLAILTHTAIKDKLICICIDHGLMRFNEIEEIKNNVKLLPINIYYLNKSNEFLMNLKSVSDPEEKRKIIGKLFIDSLCEFIIDFCKNNDLNIKEQYFIQGTIAPDVIESGNSNTANIKSHHNVGGIPSNLPIRLYEPIRSLFKNDVRDIAKLLNISESLIHRKPFPGPGLSIRIIGNITLDKIKKLQKADYIVQQEVKNYEQHGEQLNIWQFPVILIDDVKSVGVKGDKRVYESVIVLRPISSIDGMTAEWQYLPYGLLKNISKRIVNECDGINRVVLDITDKPPASIEWE